MRKIKLFWVGFFGAIFFLIPFIAGGAYIYYQEEQSVILAWPKDTVTYYNASRWSKEVDIAVKQWNNSQATPTLYQTNNRQYADILIQEGGERCKSRYACVWHTGWLPGVQAWIQLPSEETVTFESQDVSRDTLTQVTAHELGHVFGLSHSVNTCSLMFAKSLARNHCVRKNINLAKSSRTDGQFSNGSSTCSEPCIAKEQYICGPTTPDLKNIKKLYNKEVKPDYNPMCVR
jgi:hypothetical protein